MRVSGLAVSEEAVLYAMRVAFEEFKVVLEPSGAIALGAVLMKKICCKGKTFNSANLVDRQSKTV